ncbi:hypothetical protein PINS_up017061 [Pythium insidiosum]|nr:hypothetical protein PINS_up017061 [Pythium insidiosum]
MADDTSQHEAVVTAVAPFQEGVEPRESRIAGAGQGLFATRRHARGDVVCDTWTRVAASTCWRDTSTIAETSDAYNVVFEKRPQEDKALVIALRDIEAGEELYVDYGRFYWIAYNLMHPDRPVR